MRNWTYHQACATVLSYSSARIIGGDGGFPPHCGCGPGTSQLVTWSTRHTKHVSWVDRTLFTC